MIVTLIRFALVAPSGDAGTEPPPPIGLAYLAGMCKDADTDLDVKGLDIVRSSFPSAFRKFMTSVLKDILSNRDKELID